MMCFLRTDLFFREVQDLLDWSDGMIEAGVVISAAAEEKDTDRWVVRLYTTEAERLAKELNAQDQNWQQEEVEDCDWVKKNLETFSPLEIGPFYIYGSHLRTEDLNIPSDQIPLLMDAGCAFGSGRHATTEGCLGLMSQLAASGLRPSTVLDLGCGSGILAIAAKLLWPEAHVYAIDNDPDATLMTGQYAQKNEVDLTIITNEGLCELALPSFDLIIANILANPLKMLAPDLLKALTPQGKIILSGLLETQAAEVLPAYAPLHLEDQILAEGWGAYLLVF